LRIAENTPEAKGLYALHEGLFDSCVEKQVLRPCDTDWVTCVEDAWMVHLLAGEECGVKHDGRIGVNILIDEITGEIRSRFPEADYFASEVFCRDDFDCLMIPKDTVNGECMNFIFGQLKNDKSLSGMVCKCLESVCTLNK